MREVADNAGVFFADLGAAALHQPPDLLNRTVEDSFRASLEPVRRMFDHGQKVKDGLHPNAAGYKVMAGLVQSAIDRTLAAAPAPVSEKKRRRMFGIGGGGKQN